MQLEASKARGGDSFVTATISEEVPDNDHGDPRILARAPATGEEPERTHWWATEPHQDATNVLRRLVLDLMVIDKANFLIYIWTICIGIWQVAM